MDTRAQTLASQDGMSRQRKKRKRELAFFLVSVLLLVLFVVSVNVGSLRVSIGQLLRGLFLEYDETVATIYDLRFPRVLLSMLAGAAISVSGVLFQAILKNPLADPGIIGISGGASFAAVLIIGVAPTLYFFTPVFAFLGGLGAFCIVYGLSWRGGLSPLRIILVGVAVSAMFSGLSGAFNYMTGSALSGVSSLVNGNITMKTWDDVHMMLPYVLVGLILSMLSARTCNLLSLGDRTVRGLGINVQIMRLYLSLIAVLLASISTALVGAISFLGLIVPHIGRLLMGTDHRRLLPFSMLLGAFVFLLADTLGRTVAAPYEIPAGILMSVIGGPFFVILLRRSKKYARS